MAAAAKDAAMEEAAAAGMPPPPHELSFEDNDGDTVGFKLVLLPGLGVGCKLEKWVHGSFNKVCL